MADASQRAHDPHDQADRMIDLNLRAVGARLPRPADPSAGDVARWKQHPNSTLRSTPAPAGAVPLKRPVFERGARFMKQLRPWSFAGLGSAVAAGVGLCAVLMWPTAGTTVQASTIFASLQQAMAHAFKMTFDNVAADGVHLSGHLIAAYPEDDVADADVGLMQFNLAVQGEPGSQQYGGLEVTLTGALGPDDPWIYVKTAGLPAAMLEAQPMLALLQFISSNGLVINLTGVDSGSITPQEHPASEGGSIVIGGSPPEDAHGIKVGFSLGMSTAQTPAPSGPAEPAATLTTASNIEFFGPSSDGDYEGLLASVFRGTATPQQIQQLVQRVEQAAQQVDIQNLGGGRFLLTASDFDFGPNGPPVSEPWLADVVLEISYHESEGVEWAGLHHVGDLDGTIRLDLADVAIDEAALDMSHYVEQGATVLELGAILSLLQGASN